MNRHARFLLVFVQFPEPRRQSAILGNLPFMDVDTAHSRDRECGSFQNSRTDDNSEVCIHPSQNISSGGTVEVLHVFDRNLKHSVEILQHQRHFGKRAPE